MEMIKKMSIKQIKGFPYAIPIISVTVILVIIIIPLPLLLTYEQPSIFLDFDSVQSPEINFETIILKNGDNQIHGSEYYNNSLWFSTRTNPARVIKMNPDTLEYEKTLLDGSDGEDIIEANGSIFVIIYNGPTKVIKINPDNLKVEKTIEIKEMTHGGSLIYDFGYLWAGGGVGKIAKININNYSYTIYNYPTGNQFHALTSGDGFLWGSCPSSILGNTVIFKINPDSPEIYKSVIIKKKVTDDMTYLDALYVGSENQHLGAESFLYKIYNNLTYIPVTTQKTIRCYGVFQNDGFLWAAYTGSPGIIIKFNKEFELINVIRLPDGYNDANEIVWDSNGNMFVTCFQSPAKIVKLNIASS